MTGKKEKNVGLVVILEIIILLLGFVSTSQLSIGLNEEGSTIGWFLSLGSVGLFQTGACIVITILVIPACVIYLSKTRMLEIGKRFHAVRILSFLGFVLSVGNVAPQLAFAGYGISIPHSDQVGVFLLFMIIFIVLAALHFLVFLYSGRIIKANNDRERT